MVEQSGPASMEHILASELYPKTETVYDDDILQVPFPTLCGESVSFIGRTAEGVIALSNFRLFVRFEQSFVNIALGMIESIECRDIFFLHVFCKDARSIRCVFSTNEACLEWYKRLTGVLNVPRKLQEVFAFAFHAWCADECANTESSTEQHACANLCQPGDGCVYSFGKEVERMGFDLKNAWRITSVNEDFSTCPTYPASHVVPKSITDTELEAVAGFRSSRRFPSVVWRDRKSGAVIARCSQPEVGWLGWRNTHDESLLQAISGACSLNPGNGATNTNTSSLALNSLPNGELGMAEVKPSVDPDPGPRKMLIIDARSYAAAVANRAKGGGVECSEYYPNCEIQFMSLANIHTIRKSFQALRTLCAASPDQTSWLTGLENTKWLHHMSSLLRAATLAASAVDKEGRPVLVHCSDGWDRTPQITTLAQLMLDPYYRTIEGFQVVVEREWLEFGHKFADRCGSGVCLEDVNERCPVFLQFLDCVHQLLRQFPCAFQFSEAFLVKLVQHTYSCLFGTFLCNASRQRREERVLQQTSSVWSLLKPNNTKFRNYLYNPVNQHVLHPSCHLRHLRLWSAVYLSDAAPAASTPAEEGLEPVSSEETLHGDTEQTLLPKTRSCDDIVSAVEAMSPSVTRRLSDPSISTDTDPNRLLSEKAKILENGIVSKEKESEIEDLDTRIEIGENSVKYTKQPSEGSVDIPREVALNAVKSECNGLDSPPDSESDTTLCETLHGENDASVKAEVESSHKENIVERTDGDCNGNMPRENSIETSTDTLTGDLEHTPVTLGKQVSKDTGPIVNGFVQNGSKQDDGDLDMALNEKSDTLLKDLKRPVSDPDQILTLGKTTSIATSTSDISDPYIYGHHLANGHAHCAKQAPAFSGNHLRLEGLARLKLGEVFAQAGVVDSSLPVKTLDNLTGQSSSKVSHSSADSSDTPGSCHSRTPSSTSPPTPGTESKSMWRWRGSGGLVRQLDCDGLTTWVEASQQRLAQLESDYQARIDQLHRQLHVAKLALCHYAAGVNGNGTHLHDNKDEILSLPESLESGEHTSLGGGSTAASDVSWEQVEEREANMTLWVPDHAVTHCAGCDTEFWIVRRKHHCRNCGKVFCGECTSFSVPVPQQYLNQPVRVCRPCFKGLHGDSFPVVGFTPVVSPDSSDSDSIERALAASMAS